MKKLCNFILLLNICFLSEINGGIKANIDSWMQKNPNKTVALFLLILSLGSGFGSGFGIWRWYKRDQRENKKLDERVKDSKDSLEESNMAIGIARSASRERELVLKELKAVLRVDPQEKIVLPDDVICKNDMQSCVDILSLLFKNRLILRSLQSRELAWSENEVNKSAILNGLQTFNTSFTNFYDCFSQSELKNDITYENIQLLFFGVNSEELKLFGISHNSLRNTHEQSVYSLVTMVQKGIKKNYVSRISSNNTIKTFVDGVENVINSIKQITNNVCDICIEHDTDNSRKQVFIILKDLIKEN
jgi:hypothetical protein